MWIITRKFKKIIKNNKLIHNKDLEAKKKKNVFTEEVNKIALSVNDDKRIQSINLI